MKRISFNKENAEHIFEYLRFYWEMEYKDDPNFFTKKIKKELGKYGGCSECERIGKRLENFIGKDSVDFIEKLIKKDMKKSQ